MWSWSWHIGIIWWWQCWLELYRQYRIFCSSTVSFHVKTGGQAGRLPGTVFIINTILHRPGVCAGPHPAHNPGKQGLLKEFFIWKGLPWWPEIRETQQNNCCTCSIQQWSIRIVHSILEKRFSLCVLWVVRVSTWYLSSFPHKQGSNKYENA